MHAARIHEDLSLRVDEIDDLKPVPGTCSSGSTPPACAGPTCTSSMA